MDNRVLTINEAACEILHSSPEQAVGSPVASVIPGLAEVIAPLAASDALRRGEISVPREGMPPLVLGVSVSPLSDHANRPLGRIVNFQDLTEMREMEKSMQRAERLAVIGGLAAGVAHEIRNPLASISGSIELLTSGIGGDDDSRALAEIVHREVTRLNTLISELLDYANPRPLAPAEIDVGELVTETLRVFEQDRDFAGVDLVGDIAPGALTIVADPEKLRQVLWNLLRNAAEAARSGGTVKARVTRHGVDGVEIAVSDNGPGIPSETLDRVFDPFFTTKQGGSGLGLATVQAIVTDHGGSIHATSERGKGATFVVRLPYTAAAA
jgi:two-component system sensor histidine kinase PilS (NtrC family)